MPESEQVNNEPQGDPGCHLDRAALEKGLRSLPARPVDAGRVMLIVRRQPDGARQTLDHVHVTPETGLPGDKWGHRPSPNPEAQLTVMSHAVAELIANGQSLTVFGDNLFVDIDISSDNLPATTRLRVGEAVVEVTPLPHNGCHKFRQRFGADAMVFVNAAPTRNQNLRGVHWKIIQGGDIYLGAPIEVISRPEE